MTERRPTAGHGWRHGLVTCLPPLLMLACASPVPSATYPPTVQVLALPGHPYEDAREALVQAIEREGLVISATSAFGDMLARTDRDLQHGAGGIYTHAEVLFFCSTRVAAQLAQEDPANVALCPLSMALFETAADATVQLSWRAPDNPTPGGNAARALLARIASATRADLPPPLSPR